MAVDQVVAGAGVVAVALDVAGELRQVVDDGVLVAVAGRAGIDVDDASVLADLDDVRHVRVLAPGEDVRLHAEAAEAATELTDVDVHAARLPAAERGQRAGVNAQDGDTQHPGLLRGAGLDDGHGAGRRPTTASSRQQYHRPVRGRQYLRMVPANPRSSNCL